MLKQGNLFFLLFAYARSFGFDIDRLNTRGLAFFNLFGHLDKGLFPRLASTTGNNAIANVEQPAVDPIKQPQSTGTGGIHQPEPGESGEKGHAAKKQCQEKQRGPQETKACGQSPTNHITKDTTAAEGHWCSVLEVKIGQAGSGGHRQDKTDAVEGQVQCLRSFKFLIGFFAIEHPGPISDHEWEQIGHQAEHIEENIREPGTDAPAHIGYFAAHTTVGPARVIRAVAEQCNQQIDRQGADQNQRPFP